MKTRALLIGFAAAIALAGSASAQLRSGTVELNGFAGYLFGGTLGTGPADPGYPNNFDVHLGNDLNYGGRFGYNFNNSFEVEAEYATTKTDLVRQSRRASDQNFGRVEIQYLMAYMTFNFGHGRGVPYFTIGGGAGVYTPTVDGVEGESTSRATLAFGGGYKYFIDPHFALRFDGRSYSTDLGNRTFVCSPYSVCTYNGWANNFVLSGGIILAF